MLYFLIHTAFWGSMSRNQLKINKFYIAVRRLSIFMFIASIMLYSNHASAAYNNKYASIVIDATSGQVLSERHANKKLHPASLTKIMTIYLAFDALQSGKLKKWQKLPVSRHATNMVPSKLGLKAGSKIRVDDAISVLVTKSANDVAVVLAEAIAGSEANFAKMMTRKARILGMRSTTFKNASGLHHPRQISTARDMSILARSFLLYHPDNYHYFSMKSFTYAGKTYRNHNKLMSSYRGMDGIKTGYVRASGFNLVASVLRDGRRLIGVVFGGRSGHSRNRHMATLLDKGYAKATRYQLAKWHNPPPIPTRRPVEARIRVASNHTNIQDNFATITRYPKRKQAKHLDMMGLIVGEGDAEIAETLKTMSKTTAGISKTKNQNNRKKSHPKNWQIQIGAFTTLNAAHNALNKTTKMLRKNSRQAISPRVIPLATQRGTIYRARIAGLSKPYAIKTCAELNSCIIMASNSTNSRAR